MTTNNQQSDNQQTLESVAYIITTLYLLPVSVTAAIVLSDYQAAMTALTHLPAILLAGASTLIVLTTIVGMIRIDAIRPYNL